MTGAGSPRCRREPWSARGPPAAPKTRKTGRPPGLPHTGATGATTLACCLHCTWLPDGFRAPAGRLRTLLPGLSVIAGATRGAGDGPQPQAEEHSRTRGAPVSHTAIAAVLGRTDLSMGERLVALSLASFADRDHRAFPGNAAAAARAGLGRSRYLQAREQLVARGLVAIESAGRGRGQAATLIALFAQSGPWWEGEINARLLEQVLTRSPVRGPARLLLVTLAALADESGMVNELSTSELCHAAGPANSTYRHVRTLCSPARGRARL